MRKCNSLIRTNSRHLEREITRLQQLELRTKKLIQTTSRRKQGLGVPPTTEIRSLARELVRIRHQQTRLATSKAQLESVGMQVKEAFSVRKIEGSIRASTGVMKDVNTLVKLPELTGTMRELSMELMKAGIIEEMVGDALPSEEEAEDEEAEEEVDKVLSELTGERFEGAGSVPVVEVPTAEVEEEPQADMDEMRRRLDALKS